MADLHSGHAIGGWETGYTGIHRRRRKSVRKESDLIDNRGWEWCVRRRRRLPALGSDQIDMAVSAREWAPLAGASGPEPQTYACMYVQILEPMTSGDHRSKIHSTIPF